MAHKRRVVGNWKMNGSMRLVQEMLGGIESAAATTGSGEDSVEVSICVPYPYLAAAIAQIQQMPQACHVRIGAQNVSEFQGGAYTGEVSASMLRELGCQLAIVGHSERRHGLGESDQAVANKLQRLVEAQIFGVFCVGETLAERDAGNAQARIEKQLQPLQALLDSGLTEAQFCIAYEPVWAIGTQLIASNEQIANMHKIIKQYLALPVSVLYGGSVKADNAANVMAIADVDGVLVGGASLDVAAFTEIYRAAYGK